MTRKLILILMVGVGGGVSSVKVALAYNGEPLAPRNLWQAWNWDPAAWLALALAAWAFERGLERLRKRGGASEAQLQQRAKWFYGGLAALFVALFSPLAALSDVLLSAHMIQHTLLIAVAAPLMALSRAATPILLAAPAPVRNSAGRLLKRTGLARFSWRGLAQPVMAWGLHALALWFWHAPVYFEAALENRLIHRLEHFSFFATAALFWGVVWQALGRNSGRQGFGVVYLLTMTLQSLLLGVLMMVSSTPWYFSYVETAPAWGLTSLHDQHLAGTLLWLPASLVYAGAALVLFRSWLASGAARSAESDTPTSAPQPQF